MAPGNHSLWEGQVNPESKEESRGKIARVIEDYNRLGLVSALLGLDVGDITQGFSKDLPEALGKAFRLHKEENRLREQLDDFLEDPRFFKRQRRQKRQEQQEANKQTQAETFAIDSRTERGRTQSSPDTCRRYRDTGACRFGNMCFYKHEGQPDTAEPSIQEPKRAGQKRARQRVLAMAGSGEM